MAAHAIVVGLGAIGSHLVPHLARSARIGRLTLVDPGRYDTTNLASQQISRRQAGRAKTVVQAAIAGQINPALAVVPVRTRFEDLPLGSVRASVILSCVDSRRARMAINQAACRLGLPWIDAGVGKDSLLARVRVYVPAANVACYECGWSRDDYDADVLEATYACVSASSAATAAPSALGALAASLQALECDKLLAGEASTSLAGREVLVGAAFHTHAVTSFRRNPACRMPDHHGWQIDAFGDGPDRTTVGDVVAQAGALRGASTGLSLGVAGQRLAATFECSDCRRVVRRLRLVRSSSPHAPNCDQCGQPLAAASFGVSDVVCASGLDAATLNESLATVGLQDGDVMTLRTPEIEAHWELGGYRA